MKILKNDLALNDLNKLILIDSTYKHAYYMRGLIHAASGNHEMAVSDFEKQEIRKLNFVLLLTAMESISGKTFEKNT